MFTETAKIVWLPKSNNGDRGDWNQARQLTEQDLENIGLINTNKPNDGLLIYIAQHRVISQLDRP